MTKLTNIPKTNKEGLDVLIQIYGDDASSESIEQLKNDFPQFVDISKKGMCSPKFGEIETLDDLKSVWEILSDGYYHFGHPNLEKKEVSHFEMYKEFYTHQHTKYLDGICKHK